MRMPNPTRVLVFLSWLWCGTVSQAFALTEYTEHGAPTNFEQYNLELINRGRLDPTAEAARYGIALNEGLPAGTISTAPKPPLAMNQILISTARAHSQDMNTRNYFDHNTLGTGTTPFQRMTNAGYIWNYAGENIAWSSSNAGPSKAMVDSFHQLFFVDAGIPGRGHRLNLMDPNFKEVGLGFGWGTSGTYETEDFGRRSTPQIFLAGVVYNDANTNNFYDPGEGLGTVTLSLSQGTLFAKTGAAGGYAVPLTGLTGSLTVTASGGALSGSIVKTITLNGSSMKLDFKSSEATNQAPTVATAASATPSPATGTTTALSALGADDGGAAALTYTWATTGSPPAAVTFSANGTNAAKNSTATFTKAGAYTFQVTIRDAPGLTVTSSISVTVNQTVTTITVAPPSARVRMSSTRQFAATASDQFGNVLSSQPAFGWTVSGGGSINTAGLFTAGTATGGPFTVTASAAGKSGTASILVIGIASDFNTDRKADILLRHPSSGEVILWLME